MFLPWSTNIHVAEASIVLQRNLPKRTLKKSVIRENKSKREKGKTY